MSVSILFSFADLFSWVLYIVANMKFPILEFWNFKSRFSIGSDAHQIQIIFCRRLISYFPTWRRIDNFERIESRELYSGNSNLIVMHEFVLSFSRNSFFKGKIGNIGFARCSIFTVLNQCASHSPIHHMVIVFAKTPLEADANVHYTIRTKHKREWNFLKCRKVGCAIDVVVVCGNIFWTGELLEQSSGESCTSFRKSPNAPWVFWNVGSID